MTDDPQPKRYFVDHKNLPMGFPTHMHSAEFWEALGRTIATFGFLEETLGNLGSAYKGIWSQTGDKSHAVLSNKE